jgi:gas vesicle protein
MQICKNSTHHPNFDKILISNLTKWHTAPSGTAPSGTTMITERKEYITRFKSVLDYLSDTATKIVQNPPLDISVEEARRELDSGRESLTSQLKTISKMGYEKHTKIPINNFYTDLIKNSDKVSLDLKKTVNDVLEGMKEVISSSKTKSNPNLSSGYERFDDSDFANSLLNQAKLT